MLVRIAFEGANDVVPVGRESLPYPSHFLLGSDPTAWRSNVPSYRQIAYEGLYEGIDLVYRISEGALKYDLVVAPGADLQRVVVRYDGIHGLRLDSGGNLQIRTKFGDFHDSSPVALQGEDQVLCSFALRSTVSHGFHCTDLDPMRTLVIDPLLYATFLGGSDIEYGWSLAVDTGGEVLVAGHTQSPDFPATPGAFDTGYHGSLDAFVAKMDPNGSSLVYATYLGGSGNDYGLSIALGSDGSYVTGTTSSPDFPVTTGAYDASLNGTEDAYVVKLDPTGSSLEYATYLGGTGIDRGLAIAVREDRAHVTGSTSSVDFPITAGALDGTLNGTEDAFVARLNETGAIVLYGTYFGGSAADLGAGIAVDRTGLVYVSGETGSADFPATPGAFDTTVDGALDAFVAKFDPSGPSISYATYLGGSRGDGGLKIAIDAGGSAYVAGRTSSPDLPVTPGAFDSSFGGILDAFVAKVDPTGSFLHYAAYLGGSGSDDRPEIAIDAAGTAYVTGLTSSTDFPATPGAFDTTFGGMLDAFVANVDASGTSLLYATYLGGIDFDLAVSIAVDFDGSAFVAGYTSSLDFPVTPGAFDSTLDGIADAFVAKLDFASPPRVTSATLAGGALSDLDLRWLPSLDDGLAGGPSEYRVLRAVGIGGPFTEIATVPANGSPSYSYLCSFCGHVVGDTGTMFYRIRAIYGNATAESNLAARYARTVGPGPQLLAVPLEQADDAIPAVLQTLSYGVVRVYKAIESGDPWKAWYAGTVGDLAGLEFGVAFWVRATVAGQYTIAGLVRVNPAFSLVAGWNLVGYAAFISETRDESLAGMPVSRMEGFEPGDTDPYRLRVVGGAETLVPGDGYWVLVAAAGRWIQG